MLDAHSGRKGFAAGRCATMPSYCVYQLAENFPRELRYGDVVCKLELVRGELDGEWVFRARKITPQTLCPITRSRFGARALQAELRRGFLVEDGTAAAKLLGVTL